MGMRDMFDAGPQAELWDNILEIQDNPGIKHDRVLRKLVHGVDLDEPIYRIMTVARFVEMIQDRRLALTAPESWNDPYEAALLYGSSWGDGSDGLASFYRNSVFAQCWSRDSDCDGLWRSFAPKSFMLSIGEARTDQNSYVQIRTTVRNLLLSMLCQKDRLPGWILCGSVQYLSKQQIDGRIRTLEVTGFYESNEACFATPFEAVEAYYIKRNSFAYEEEVRLVFIGGNYAGGRFETQDIRRGRNHITIPFNPRCIESVVFDPWTSKEDMCVERFRQVIDEFSLNCQVQKADLYQVRHR